MVLIYNLKLKDRSRQLRNASTLSEVILWNEIKAKKLGHQFLRQKPVGNYIVDFYCPKLKLVIEIDGSSHDTKLEYDSQRNDYLEESGLRVLRFNDSDIKRNLDSVLSRIKEELKFRNPPFLKGVPRSGGGLCY